MRYDPDVAPDPTVWLELDEQERVAAVRKYHKHANVRVPSSEGHAVAHAVVENQLAASHAAACEALQRLTDGGLERHEAIHAIGSALMRHLAGVLESKKMPDPRDYDAELARLTVETWRRSSES